MKSINNEIVLKLLSSTNEDENFIGLNLVRARHPDNWGAFEGELSSLLNGVVIYKIGELTGKPYPKSLKEKYFHNMGVPQLRHYYYARID